MRRFPILWAAALLSIGALALHSQTAGSSSDEGSAVGPSAHSPWRGAAFELPDQSRPPTGDTIPVSGPWLLVGTTDGIRTWEAPLPIRPRSLFFHRPPDGMKVVAKRPGEPWEEARPLKFSAMPKGMSKGRTWAFSQHALQIRRALHKGPPGPNEIGVQSAKAIEREASLNLVQGDLAPEDFAFRSLQVEDTTRTGLLLPAPSRMVATVEAKPGSVLDFGLMIVPPEAADPSWRSDGAQLTVSIAGTAHHFDAAVGTPTQHRISLDPWAGQTVTLELQTLPGETDDLDYVFLTDPVIFVPRPDPARVLIVFIDTLRADHMTIYGHDKATTPKLEAWAQRAAVFENARSVAPWTLPSARTLVTGAVPERWGKVPTLSDQVRDAGWATSFIVGNVYLSSNFGLSEGWGEHRAINWPSADVQVSRALDFLKAHPDRPSLQIVHFMDTHLPYSEPRRYRNLFAGETPEQLGDDTFHHKEVKKAASAMGAEGKQYIRDRYDNNLRVVDDEVWRLLDAMPEDSLVVIMSDHGEEFWEHGGLEHGHSLYDELLHVPLIVKGPGIEAGRFAEPTSLLDIAPTIAQHLGLSQSGMDGWPLQDLIDGSRQSDFADRALAFGRPLYGTRRWGVLWDGHKYMVHEGRERLHDLRTDGAEQTNLRKADTDIEPWLAAMAKGMKTEVSMGFRLHATAKKSPDPLVVHLEIPGGVRTAVVGEDYLRRSEVSIEIIEGAKSDTLIATWAANKAGTREVFIVPEGPLELAAAGARLTVVAGDAEGVARPSSPLPPLTDGRGRTLMTARAGGRSVSLKPMAVPLPLEGSVELAAVDDEMAAELEALGYLDGSE